MNILETYRFLLFNTLLVLTGLSFCLFAAVVCLQSDTLKKILAWRSRVSLLSLLVVLPFVCVMVVRGSTKFGNGNMALLSMMQPNQDVAINRLPVTEEEIRQGYRYAGSSGDGLVEVPVNAITNEPLRRRGGWTDVFRVKASGWTFQWGDERLTNITVCPEFATFLTTLAQKPTAET